MAVRPVDANSLLYALTQIAHGMGRISIHISDMVKVMIRVVERQPTLTPQNEPLTCAGCYYLDEQCAPCAYCRRSAGYADYYRRPPEGEDT